MEAFDQPSKSRRAELFESRQPSREVGTLASNELQANQLSYLRPHYRLCISVIGKLGDNAFAWRGMLSVVNQFRCGVGCLKMPFRGHF